MYLEAPETTDKAMELKHLGRTVLATQLPGDLSEWKVIGFHVEPGETITKYPLTLQLTLAHSEYSDLGELEEVIEDRDAIIQWLKDIGVRFDEVELDINADRYDDGGDIPEDGFKHDYADGDEL